MIEVELPDGSVAEFPDGTPREAIQKALSAHARPASTQGSQGPAPAAPEGSQGFQRAGGYGPVAAGVADAGIKTAVGLNDTSRFLEKNDPRLMALKLIAQKLGLGGDNSPEMHAALNELQAEAKADPNPGKRAIGEIGANIALQAIPASKVSKMLPAGSFVKGVGNAAATSGLTDMLVTPGSPEEKLQAAGRAAALGGGLQAGGSVLRKALTKPFRASTEAEKLMSQGIYPTLQQGADTPAGKFIGGLTSGVTDISKRQNEEVVQAFLKRVVPGVDMKNMTTSERTALMETLLNGEYDAILSSKKFTMSPADRQTIWAAARGPRGTQDESVAMALKAMSGTGRALNSTNRINFRNARMKQTRDLLQDAIDKFKGDTVFEGEARDNLIAAKRKFDELVRDPALSPDERTALADLDQRFKAAQRFFDSAKKSTTKEGVKVSDLLTSYRKLDKGNKMGFARGDDPMLSDLLEPATRVLGLQNQDEARSAMVAARRIGAPLLKGAAAVGTAAVNPATAIPLSAAYGLSALGQTKTGARAMFGDLPVQKELAELLRQTFPYTSSAGAAVSNPEY